MTIEWQDSFKIGQVTIDAQHQHLFELTNALLAAEDVPSVQRLIMQLYKHTREHFKAEEALMRQHHYPDLEAHTDYHNKLLGRLNTLSLEVGHGVLNKPALTQLMGDWALHHIQYDDAPIAAFIQQGS